MIKTYKHIPSGKIAVQTGVKSGYYVCESLIMRDWTVETGNDWEEVTDRNPLKLEAGKTYHIRYKHTLNAPVNIVEITRFTDMGYPWGVGPGMNGIITDSFEIVRYPVFITEDGKPIYAEDDYWGLNIQKFEAVWESKAKLKTQIAACYKTFSTKEAAQEYKLNHKPIFSIAMLSNLLGFNISCNTHDYIIKKAKEIINYEI